MPLITETYYLSLTQDNRGILRLRCSQDDTLRTANLKLYNNGSIFVIPSGISASVSGVKQNGAVFSKSCTISQDRQSVVLQLSSDITNVDGVIIAEIVLNDGNGDRLGTSNFIIQVEKNPTRAGIIQDTETPIEYVNDFITQIQALTARVNNLITPNGDPSLAEVVDARISSLDGNTYQNLKARIDADIATLNTGKANKSEVYTKSQVDNLLENVEIDVDNELSDESENPIQNKAVASAISEINESLDSVDGMRKYHRNVKGYFYPFNYSLKSAGTKDFNFVGVENYDADGAYHHKVTTPNNANTDLLGIKAIGVPALFSGDFTISMWYAADADCFGHPFEYATYVNYNASGSGGESDNVGEAAYFSNLTVHSQRFTAEIQNRVSTSPAFVGLLFWFSQADRRLIFAAYNHNATRLSWVNIFFPNSINTTEWHHYAFTRNGDTLRFFFDGELVLSMSCLASTIYPAGQIAIGNLFEQTLTDRKKLTATKYGEKYKDLYISDECKWVAAFDPTEILY